MISEIILYVLSIHVSVAFPCGSLNSTTYPLVFLPCPALNMTSGTTVPCSTCYHIQLCHRSSHLHHSKPTLVTKCQ